MNGFMATVGPHTRLAMKPLNWKAVSAMPFCTDCHCSGGEASDFGGMMIFTRPSVAFSTHLPQVGRILRQTACCGGQKQLATSRSVARAGLAAPASAMTAAAMASDNSRMNSSQDVCRALCRVRSSLPPIIGRK